MDRGRSLVLLSSADQAAHTVPLVGCWVAGNAGVRDPLVAAACLRFLCRWGRLKSSGACLATGHQCCCVIKLMAIVPCVVCGVFTSSCASCNPDLQQGSVRQGHRCRRQLLAAAVLTRQRRGTAVLRGACQSGGRPVTAAGAPLQLTLAPRAGLSASSLPGCSLPTAAPARLPSRPLSAQSTSLWLCWWRQRQRCCRQQHLAALQSQAGR